MLPILAQAGAAYDVGHLLIVVVVIAALVAVALVGARAAGVVIPPFIFTVAWILVAALVAVFAIRFLIGLL